jgi:hypothetical protein
MTFQWPGGVSDFGPSAQNHRSSRSHREALDWRHTLAGGGFCGRPEPSFVPSALFPRALGPMSTAPSSGSSWLE